jgi:hypothetical protein
VVAVSVIVVGSEGEGNCVSVDKTVELKTGVGELISVGFSEVSEGDGVGDEVAGSDDVVGGREVSVGEDIGVSDASMIVAVGVGVFVNSSWAETRVPNEKRIIMTNDEIKIGAMLRQRIFLLPREQ